MKKIITMIIISICSAYCHAQLLIPKYVLVQLNDGDMKMAAMHAYSDTTLIIKRFTKDTTNCWDTIHYKDIAKVKLILMKNPKLGTWAGSVAGITGGVIASVGIDRNTPKEPEPNQYENLDLSGVAYTFVMCSSICGGTAIGVLLDACRRPKQYRIYGNKEKFHAMIAKYKM